MPHQGGDDLDDFVIEKDFIASGSEAEWDGAGDDFDVEEITALQDSSESSNLTDSAKKRKRKDGEKGKKTKKLKTKIEPQMAYTSSVADHPPHHLAEYLAAMQARTFSDMTPLELEDKRIPEYAIVDTTTWTQPRMLDHLGEFISTVTPTLRTRLSQRSKSNGAPTLIFVAGAALRVVDVTRIIKQSKELRTDKSGEVAKLFARHIKLSEHVQYLKRTKVCVAVGTPGRIGKLLEQTDALSTSALTHIFIDTTYQDAKKRSLLDIHETRDELFRTVIGSDQVMTSIRSRKTVIVLF